jgi:hypothetical protein
MVSLGPNAYFWLDGKRAIVGETREGRHEAYAVEVAKQ